MKNKTKVESLWEVSKEQEEEFKKFILGIIDMTKVDDLFKLIRGAEYRRGKEDGKKDSIDKDILREKIAKWRVQLEDEGFITIQKHFVDDLLKDLLGDGEVKE